MPRNNEPLVPKKPKTDPSSPFHNTVRGTGLKTEDQLKTQLADKIPVSRVRDPEKFTVVTGGAGFLGTHLIKELNSRGQRRILVVDDLSDPNKIQNINCLEFLDYTDKDDFINVLDAACSANLVNEVYHLGAESSTTCTDGKYLMKNNYQYTCNIMEICSSARVPLVYASSASVYGEQTKEWGNFNDKSDDYTPQSYYALSKLQADKYARKFAENPKDYIIGLRYFNVMSDGEHEQHKSQKSPLCWMREQYNRSGFVQLFEGSKDYYRDFIHVDEAIKTTINAMTQGKTGVYNLGMGEAKSFYDLALEVVDNEDQIKFIPMPEDIAKGYQTYTKADMTNACFGIPTS